MGNGKVSISTNVEIQDFKKRLAALSKEFAKRIFFYSLALRDERET